MNGAEISLSPNPAHEFVKIEITNGLSLNGLEAIVLSTDGRFTAKKKIEAYDFSMRTIDLPNGAYSLIIMRGNEILQSKKLIVLHEK